MKLGVCKDTCAPGINYFIEGREYFVDETDRFIQRHFIFKDEIADDPEPDQNVAIPPTPTKKSRKKKSE